MLPLRLPGPGKSAFASLVLGLFAFFALSLPGRTPAQSPRGPDSLLFRKDSLERALRQRSVTEPEKRRLTQCIRTKRAYLTEKRAANPEVARTDSALRALKLKGLNPDHPDAARLMERKYSLEKGFEDGWLATAEGKRCGEIEAARQRRGDSAVAADPEYRQLLERIRRQGML
jgi:hypothetical protein